MSIFTKFYHMLDLEAVLFKFCKFKSSVSPHGPYDIPTTKVIYLQSFKRNLTGMFDLLHAYRVGICDSNLIKNYVKVIFHQIILNVLTSFIKKLRSFWKLTPICKKMKFFKSIPCRYHIGPGNLKAPFFYTSHNFN